MLETVLRLPLWLVGALVLNFWIVLAIPIIVVKLAGGWFFSIPAGSMRPALSPGDHILALHAGAELERGAIYVFKHPKLDVDYIKRLVGLPGESIQLIDGVFYIEGVAVQRKRLPDYALRSTRHRISVTGPPCVREGDSEYVCHVAQFEEILPNGKSYRTLDLSQTQTDNWGPKTVPEGHVMMMGDHRDNSVDSRFSGVGFVPIDNIRYRPWVFFLGFDDLPGTWSKFLRPVEGQA